MTALTTPTAAWELAAVAGRAAAAATEEDLALAADCVLDWVGVAVGARREEAAAVLRGFERHAGAGPSTSLCSGSGLPPQTAALVNGTLAHVLDYDDVMAELPGHCGAPVVAAALAAGEMAGASWGTVLRAITAGVEVMCVLGDSWGPGLSRRGWHPTATLGVFGAAAAAAVAIDAGESRLAASLAAATLGSAGIKHSFGSHGKSWQVGLAAHNGVLAALAAESGLAVTGDILDPERGWPLVYTGGGSSHVLFAHRSAHRIHDTVFKRYATCFATHCAIAAAERLGLREADPGRIEAIDVEIGPRYRDIVSRGTDSGLELKFNVAATVALVALGHDLSDPAVFTDATAQLPRLRDLLARVRTRCNPKLRDVEAVVHVRDEEGERSQHESPPGPITAAERRTVLTRKLTAVLAASVPGDEVGDFVESTRSRARERASVEALRKPAEWSRR
jgi:2-methylcitrate dehydratase PrpD